MSGNLSAKLSFTYIRTYSSGAFSGVKLVVLLEVGFDLLSSLLSLIQVNFLLLFQTGVILTLPLLRFSPSGYHDVFSIHISSPCVHNEESPPSFTGLGRTF